MGAVEAKPVPSWFRAALSTTRVDGDVQVGGTTIRFRSWGPANQPGVVLIHGGAGHAGWWDHIAPLLCGTRRVVAFDLSGHGDSDRRPSYSHDVWADEALAVAEAGAIDGPPILVGHSMGGWVALTAAAKYAHGIGGVVIIDSPVRARTSDEEANALRMAANETRYYSNEYHAIARFRTVPEQPHSLPFIIDHVARTSLRQTPSGWTWKHDPAVFLTGRPNDDILKGIESRAAVFRSEQGMITPEIAARMSELLPGDTPIVEIPLAGHHAMLDQPLLLVMALRTILADWERSSRGCALEGVLSSKD